MEALAVTGYGTVSPVGVGADAWTQALSNPEEAAKRAIKPVELDASGHAVHAHEAAIVPDFDPKEYLGSKGLRNFDRITTFLLVAAKHALENSGIKRNGEFQNVDPERVGVCISTAYGSLDAITELKRVAELEDPRFINPSRFPNTVINSAAGYVSIWEDLRGSNTTVVDGNCGAINAVMHCETHIHNQRGDVYLVGGAEVFNAPFYLALEKLGLVGKKGPLVLGEGAALLCVEEIPHAKRRGAKVLAEIRGYGTAFEPPASNALLAHAAPEAVERAIRSALDDAGMKPSDIDACCGAASGFPMIDDAERLGIHRVFGRDLPSWSPKRITGETHGASGAFAMLAGVSWIQGVSVSQAPKAVLAISIGYYGNASAVVLCRAQDSEHS